MAKPIFTLCVLTVTFCVASGSVEDDLPESQTEIIRTGIGTAAFMIKSPVFIMTTVDTTVFNDAIVHGNYCSVNYPTAMNISWASCGGDDCSMEIFSMPDENKRDYVYINETEMWSQCKSSIGHGRTINDNDTSFHFIDQDMFHLDMSGNAIAQFPKGFFCGLNKLKNLYLAETLLDDSYNLGLLSPELCHSFTGYCLSQLKNLDLKRNNFNVIKNGTFCTLHELIKLNLTDCKIGYIEQGGLSHLFNLTKLDLSKNKLKVLDRYVFRNLTKLEHLNLSCNIIENIPEVIFKELKALKRLFLSSNSINFLPEGLLQHQNALIELDLQNNKLKHLSDNIFSYLSNLQNLNLSFNALETIENNAFSNMTMLNSLTISDNNLTNFSMWNLANLSSLRSLGIHRNPWTCDCHYVKSYREYLQLFSNILQVTNELYCLTEVNDKMPLIGFNMGYCYNANATMSAVDNLVNNSLIWGTLLGIVLCLTVIAILAFRYRYEMQVLIFSRYGLRFGANKPDNSDKMFDVFISYSNLDEEFLVREIMPNLENIERPYNLCLHHRTFAPGAFIINSIMEAVEQSAVTLILLSNNFMKSEWCRFEFKTAHIQMLKDRCNRIIIILVGEDIPQDLDPEMNFYMKTNTYLKFSDKLFWKKLYFAMPDRNARQEEVMLNAFTYN